MVWDSGSVAMKEIGEIAAGVIKVPLKVPEAGLAQTGGKSGEVTLPPPEEPEVTTPSREFPTDENKDLTESPVKLTALIATMAISPTAKP